VLLAVLLATAFLGLLAAHASAAEEGVVNALASWQGQGRLFRTGDQQALFVGAFVGIFFVENNQGVLHAAHILCPGAIDIDLGTGGQTGEGRCVITTRGGDRVFARDVHWHAPRGMRWPVHSDRRDGAVPGHHRRERVRGEERDPRAGCRAGE
jgi:hypothetical protein